MKLPPFPLANISWKFSRVWQRNFVVWLKFYKASTIGVIGEPLLFLLALGLGVGRYISTIDGKSYLEFIAPGLWIMAPMYSATFECTYGTYVRLIYQKTFDAILATPINVEEITAADILFGAARSFFSSCVIFILFLCFGLIHTGWTLLIPLVGILTGIAFGATSIVVTSRSHTWDHFTYFYTLIISPMFLFSGIFFPLKDLPDWMSALAWCLPLTHAVNLSRGLMFGHPGLPLLSDLLWLAVYSAIMFWIGVEWIRRRVIR